MGGMLAWLADAPHQLSRKRFMCWNFQHPRLSPPPLAFSIPCGLGPLMAVCSHVLRIDFVTDGCELLRS